MSTTDCSGKTTIGAEIVAKGVRFRVWATKPKAVSVVLEGTEGKGSREVPLVAEGEGWFSATVEGVRAGDRYRFRLDGEGPFPDPASRFQPDGPHGPSMVVDPSSFVWSDAKWKGVSIEGQVIYELHVGTFTKEGTFAAAMAELSELARLGITVVELLPLADFAGKFGWGYDGVDLFAPTRLYGEPDDLRRFIDRAHAVGVAVILDVVYNHFGPSGNYLKCFSPEYFAERHANEWGEGLNYDGDDGLPVRQFFIENARYWIDEFHFDGLRLDATQSIHDFSRTHVIAEIGRAVRGASRGRRTIIVAENEPQLSRLVRTEEKGGYGLDALWNDDFHHSARVAVTGKREAYYSDHRGTAQELLSAIKHGFLFQGQRYRWQKQRRGSASLDLLPPQLILYLQNHDQVANSASGERLDRMTSSGRYRAITALLLLAPGTPMLFQGQEFAASSPFLYFADHDPELAIAVRNGRREFLKQFPSIASEEAQAALEAPGDVRTFEKSKLDLNERKTHAAIYAMHEELLRLRRTEVAFRAQKRRGIDGSVLSDDAFVVRYFADDDAKDERLLFVNLGVDRDIDGLGEPLLAPPEGCRWITQFSTDEPRFGGRGVAEVELADGIFNIPGGATVVLRPTPR